MIQFESMVANRSIGDSRLSFFPPMRELCRNPACMRAVMMACILACCVFISGYAIAGGAEEDEGRTWEESEISLPPFPLAENLVGFYVSAPSDNKFFVDSSSISVDGDGVVRYVLVIVAPGNVRNISYEGLRCETKERRLYAFGRPDGTWSKARVGRWEKVREATSNRHHAALFQDLFCPGGVVVRDLEEAQRNLRRGG